MADLEKIAEGLAEAKAESGRLQLKKISEKFKTSSDCLMQLNLLQKVI